MNLVFASERFIAKLRMTNLGSPKVLGYFCRGVLEYAASGSEFLSDAARKQPKACPELAEGDVEYNNRTPRPILIASKGLYC